MGGVFRWAVFCGVCGVNCSVAEAAENVLISRTPVVRHAEAASKSKLELRRGSQRLFLTESL